MHFDSNPFYNQHRLLKTLGWLVLFVLVCKFTKGFAFAIMLPLMFSFIAQGKSESLLGVLLVSVFALDVNAYFVPKTAVVAICQKLMMLIASAFLIIQVFGRRHSSLITPTLWLFPYLIYIAITSQYGWCPIISNLKLFLFTMVFVALYGCAVKVMNDRADVRRIREMVLVIAIFAIFGSILVRPVPSICMMGGEELLRNPNAKSMFKGMAIHSQTLGPWIAMIGTLIYGDWVYSIQRKNKLYLWLILCCPLILYMTASRTAMASFLAGVMFVSFFAVQSRMVRRSWKSKIVSWTMMIAIVGGMAVLIVPQARDKVLGFVLKYSDSTTEVTSTNIWRSRQGKLDMALNNWRRSPVIGNGFQVSEDMAYWNVQGIRDVLSAPIEKSTWTYAILEEGGVLGMILFCLFVVVALGSLIARKAYIGGAMLFTFLMVNIGEFGFFSMSATGGLFWSFTFIGIVLDYKRLKMLGALRE